MAYIFPDKDLTNNLLGLLSFANMGCTTVFKPRSFHIFKGNARTAILSGTRPDENSLWRVPIHSDWGAATDGIPPPVHAAGLYIEVNAVTVQDNVTYVKFIRACLGCPSPSTFLHAGFITGPYQVPHLTAKMMQKHLPNALTMAKGHLDRTRSNPPHADSDAVSTRRRHHTMATRKSKATKNPDHSPELFSPRDGPRSATLHLDYTGPLPEPYTWTTPDPCWMTIYPPGLSDQLPCWII
jgi:hypothetical protein